MPVWAAILIAILSGLGAGLIGTLVKASEDRQAEVRRATIEAAQDFAALATEWFALVGEAIERHDLGPDEPAIAKARATVQEGNKRLDRLAVLLGPESDVVQRGAQTLHYLSMALDELPEELANIEPDITPDEEAELDALPDEEREDKWADLRVEIFDDAVAEAEMLHRLGLESWGNFADAASAELRRDLFHGARVALARRRSKHGKVRGRSDGKPRRSRRAEPDG